MSYGSQQGPKGCTCPDGSQQGPKGLKGGGWRVGRRGEEEGGGG